MTAPNPHGGTLTDQELSSFFVLLVAAGNETTRNAISHGMKLLTDYPDQRALWLDDFAGRGPGAVEEIVRRLRWKGPVYRISGVTRQGTQQMCFDIMRRLEEIRLSGIELPDAQ